MVGELYLGGEGVVCGYLECLVLIVECFVLDFFGVLGSWLYCSGDLICGCVDGVVDYFGWVDY